MPGFVNRFPNDMVYWLPNEPYSVGHLMGAAVLYLASSSKNAHKTVKFINYTEDTKQHLQYNDTLIGFGGVFDPSTNHYDPSACTEYRPEDDSIYGVAGLVWREVGMELLRNITTRDFIGSLDGINKRLTNAEYEATLTDLHVMVDQQIMKPFDACKTLKTLSHNEPDNEAYEEITSESASALSLPFAAEILNAPLLEFPAKEQQIIYLNKGATRNPALEFVRNAINDIPNRLFELSQIFLLSYVQIGNNTVANKTREDTETADKSKFQKAYRENGDCPILILEESKLDWKSLLLDINQDKHTAFVIMPFTTDSQGTKKQYRLHTVPKGSLVSTPRVSMPYEWYNKHSEALVEVTGAKDAVFCHPSGQTAGFLTLQTAILAACTAIRFAVTNGDTQFITKEMLPNIESMMAAKLKLMFPNNETENVGQEKLTEKTSTETEKIEKDKPINFTL